MDSAKWRILLTNDIMNILIFINLLRIRALLYRVTARSQVFTKPVKRFVKELPLLPFYVGSSSRTGYSYAI